MGAVIIPATTLLNRDDLVDRFARGQVRHVVASADNAGKFADLPATTRGSPSAGQPPAGIAWTRVTTLRQHSSRMARPGRATRCCSISPRARRPSRSWSCTATRAIRSGMLSTMYWLGAEAGRRPSQHLFAGLGQARLELLFRAVERGGYGVHAQPAAFQRQAACSMRFRAAVSPRFARRRQCGAC